MSTPEDAGVRYTVKELLARVEGKVDMLVSHLDSKADADTVNRLTRRVEALERWRSFLAGAVGLLAVIAPIAVVVMSRVSW